MQNKLYASIVTVFFLLLLFFAETTFNLGLTRTVQSAFAPVSLVFSNIGASVSGFFGGISNIGNLQKENAELKLKVNSVLSENAAMKVANDENTSLKKDLGFKQTSKLDLVPATVISFDPTLRSGINVRVDSTDGISKGKPVMAEGYLIGRVAEISGNIIRVNLIVDSTSAIPAVILGKQITGIAKGIIGSGLIMDQVPQSELVAENDLIITSGLGGDLPKGIIIAKVGEIAKVSGSIFQKVELLPMVDFSKIERVMIAK
jgi:rod shape-determining protein MreC